MERSKSLPSSRVPMWMPALTAVVAWAIGSFGGFWPRGAEVAAASFAYQYQYPATVTGSGTIAEADGQVSFSLSFKLDDTGTTGSCSVAQPKTKTKIKCLGVTSLDFFVFEPGKFGVMAKGPATINGTPTTYSITATDLGEPGVGTDGFFVKTALGGNLGPGALTSGNISIHGVS